MRGLVVAILACSVGWGADRSSIDVDALGVSDEAADELRSAIEADDWLEVEAQLFDHSQDDSGSAPRQVALALAHFENERYYQAAAAWRKADQIEALTPHHRLALATAFIAIDRRHWARPEIERLISENPTEATYPYWLAGIYYDLQWFDEALDATNRAIALDPAFASAYDRAGQCFEGLGRTAEAESAYRHAVATATEDPWPLVHLGGVLTDQGKLDEAERTLGRAVKLAPENAEAYFEIGTLLRRGDQLQRARDAFKRATELAPDEARFHYAFGGVLRSLGEAELARQALKRFRELSP